MYHRFTHLNSVSLNVGDKVKRGDRIGEIGNTGGDWTAHVHWDIFRKMPDSFLEYVNGWSKSQVKAHYKDPAKYFDMEIPIKFDHFWSSKTEHTYLAWTGSVYHTGYDLNGVGGGNADLGNPVYSPINGEVVYTYNGSGKNGGWGKMAVIKELTNKVDNMTIEEEKKEVQKYPLINEMAEAIKKHEGWYEGSRSFRNNNPANMIYNSYTKSLGAIGIEDHSNPRFAIFESEEDGMMALKLFIYHGATDQLRAYDSNMDLYDYFSKYAPSSDGNSPRNYAEAVRKDMGVDKDFELGDVLKIIDEPKEQKEYGVVEELKRAIEKITGNDNGKNMNENEQEREAQNLLDEFQKKTNEITNRNAKITNQAEEIKKLNTLIEKKELEVKDLKEALEKNSASYKILMDIKRILSSIIKFK